MRPLQLLLSTAHCVGLAIASSAVAGDSRSIYPVDHPDAFELVWGDDFDGDELDPTKWANRHSYSEREGAVNDPACVALDGAGVLRLTTSWDADSETYRCGMIGTEGRFEQRYGYFEARVRFHQHSGHHGAFWLQSNRLAQVLGDTRVSGTEIDVIEHFGSKKGLSINLHWDGYGAHHQHVSHRLPSPTASDASDNFHTYGVLWTQDAYVFFVDGAPVWRTTEAVSGVPQYLILSLLSSGWERQQLGRVRLEGGLPDVMEVDFVRVYRAVDPTPPTSD